MEEVPCRTSLAPLASPCFVLCLLGVEEKGFRLPGEGEDHFHYAVEPLPGHIRCRKEKVGVYKVHVYPQKWAMHFFNRRHGWGSGFVS